MAATKDRKSLADGKYQWMSVPIPIILFCEMQLIFTLGEKNHVEVF